MDSAFNQNQPVLAVNIVPRSLKVLSDIDSLLDQKVQFLWELWSESICPQNPLHLVSSDRLDLTDTVPVAKKRANLRWPDALFRVIADELDAVLSAEMQPVRCSPTIRSRRGGNSFAWGVETSHPKGPKQTALTVVKNVNNLNRNVNSTF